MRSAILLLAAAGLVVAGGTATAASQATGAHCTYELGAGDLLAESFADPAGVTSDGAVDVGGCTWTFPDSGGSSYAARTLDGEWHDAQVTIVDQVFGAGTVGAFACNDGDGDGLCGETDQGEVAAGFCGTSPLLTSHKDWDGGGHADLGASFSVLVDGPLGQALSGCDPASSPAGGLTGDIFVTFLGGFGPEGQAT